MRSPETPKLDYDKSLRLSTARAVRCDTGRLMPHTVSRHRALGGVDLLDPDTGSKFDQGSLFPPHVDSGTITKIEHFVVLQLYRWEHGLPTRVRSVDDLGGGALWAHVALRRYGVEEVGAIFKRGALATVFPEKLKNARKK